MRSKKPGRMLAAYTLAFPITTAFRECAALRSNSAFGSNLQLDHFLTPIADGLNGNGKSAKGKPESPLARQCPSKRNAHSDETEEEPAKSQTRNAFRFRAYWFVLAQTEGEETYVAPTPGFALIRRSVR